MLLRAIADLLCPPVCQVCRLPGAYPLCACCLATAPLLRPPLCERCGHPLVAAEAGPWCDGCLRRRMLFRKARAAGAYDGVLRDAVLALKFRGCRAMAEVLGGLMVRAVAAHPAYHRVDVVVPVPLHPARLRERGYNQAELLAHAVAGPLAAEVLPHALRRTSDTPSQVGLSVDDRRRNVWGAFAPALGVPDAVVLLVDDVISSGATAGACAKALRVSGADHVLVLAAARAVTGRGGSG